MSLALEDLQPIRNQLFLDKQPAQAWEALKPILQLQLQGLIAAPNETIPITPSTNAPETQALIELASLTLRALSRYNEAAQLYRYCGDRYQAGYCELLQGNLYAMQGDWGSVLQQRANHWCLTLFGLVTRQLNSYATMFQIRNHLESDVGNLLAAGRQDYLENILSYSDFLMQMNLESPKFLGRGMLNHLLGSAAQQGQENEMLITYTQELLLKGQKALPNDPEIYYHLGQFKHMSHEFDEALLMLKQCLMISPSYTPAKDLVQKLQAI